jgi:hypothetical protein
MNRQISVRPSSELLEEIEAISIDYQLSNAEVLRQLLVEGLKNFKEGKVTITPAKNLRFTRTTSLKISKKISGRVVNVGAYYEPPAMNTPSCQEVISSE